MDELDGPLDALLVLGVVQPAAHARRVRERDGHRLAVRRSACPTLASRLARPSSRRIASPPTGTISRGCSSRSSHSRQNEQSSCSRAAGVRSPPPAERATRIAPRDRRAVERRVERVLVEPEPAAQRLAGAAAPGPALLALDHARRLAEEVRASVQHAPRAPGATRSETPPRRTHGRHGCHAGARRATGTTSAAASRARAHDDEPVPVEEDLAVRRAPRRAPTRRSSACRPPSASRPSARAAATRPARRRRAAPSR